MTPNTHLHGIESIAARGDPAAALHALADSGLLLREPARARDLRARLLLALGRVAEAAEDAHRATGLEATNASFVVTAGWCHEALGDAPRALECFRRATELAPDEAAFAVVLGTALTQRGAAKLAIAAFRRALAIDPGNRDSMQAIVALRGTPRIPPEAWHPGDAAFASVETSGRLAAEALSTGDDAAAERHALEAVRALPDHAPAQLGVGLALANTGALERALVHFGFALDLDPSLSEAAAAGARVAGMLGLPDEASRHAAVLGRIGHPAAGLRRRLGVPAINPSVAAIAALRARYENGLDALLAEPPRLDFPETDFDWTYFFLSYHGEPNRPVNVKLARLLLAACPSLGYVARTAVTRRRSRERIRVGFASRFLRTHSIGRTTRGLLDRLDRREFEVFGIRLPPHAPPDALSSWMETRCDHWISLGEPLASARAVVESLDLDVLYYQDIGMESFGYYLSFARLAPVQCVSFGHPDTTGVPTLDYFVSTAAFEVPEAASHYSERLHLLRSATLPTYYYRPELPDTADPRSALGLPPGERLYVCPQSPFKLHPEVDELFAAILRRDPRGRVLLAQGAARAWSNQLARRFAHSIPDVADRIGFLPRLSEPRFLDLLRAADVVLDTPHFNGMNTSLEAFAAGTPIVTLPTRLQRGRHVRAMYAKMEIHDCVARSAGDYVDIAIRLGTEPDFAHQVSRTIRERAPVLYEDRAAVDDWAEFFRRSVADAALGR